MSPPQCALLFQQVVSFRNINLLIKHISLFGLEYPLLELLQSYFFVSHGETDWLRLSDIWLVLLSSAFLVGCKSNARRVFLNAPELT